MDCNRTLLFLIANDTCDGRGNLSILADIDSSKLCEGAVATSMVCYYKKEFKSGGDDESLHAEIKMLKKGLPYPVEIWLSRTPCFDCAKALIEAYKDKPKPEIHARSVYVQTQTFDYGNKHKRGLIALREKGFKVNILGIEAYRSYVEKQCGRLNECLPQDYPDELRNICLEDYSDEYFRCRHSVYNKHLVANLIVINYSVNCRVLLTLFSNNDKKVIPMIVKLDQDKSPSEIEVRSNVAL